MQTGPQQQIYVEGQQNKPNQLQQKQIFCVRCIRVCGMVIKFNTYTE